MNDFVTTKVEYVVNKSVEDVIQNMTFLNVYTTYPLNSSKRDYSVLNVYFTTTVINHLGNEVNNTEFEFATDLYAKDLLDNPNLLKEMVELAEKSYKEFFIEYGKSEIEYLQEELKKYEED
jgi:hypothetical protein